MGRFIPVLDYDAEIRTVLSSTNAIWVFDFYRQPSFASEADRWAMTLNAIDDSVLDSNCRVRRLGGRARVPGLKRACTTQPRSAGDPGPSPHRSPPRRRVGAPSSQPSTPRTMPSPASTRTSGPAPLPCSP